MKEFRLKILLFECKWHPSNEKDPKSPKWKHEETQKYYAYILNHANEYLNEKDFYSRYINKYVIGLVFTKVEFSTEEFIKDWHYNDLDPNEFYSYNNYSHKSKLYGILDYGIVEFK